MGRLYCHGEQPSRRVCLRLTPPSYTGGNLPGHRLRREHQGNIYKLTLKVSGTYCHPFSTALFATRCFRGLGRIGSLPRHICSRAVRGGNTFFHHPEIDCGLSAMMAGVKKTPPKDPDSLQPPCLGLVGKDGRPFSELSLRRQPSQRANAPIICMRDMTLRSLVSTNCLLSIRATADNT